MESLLKTDFLKYKKYGGNFISIVFFTQGFWALIQYRCASYIYASKLPLIVKKVVLLICLIWQKWIEIITGISIPASAVIGNSFYIGHFGGIILNANSIIGDNCNISQGVTIGVSGIDTKRGVPKIGDRVYIGANTTVAGKITIGNNVIIGANSLVINSVDDNSIVIGVPAVVKKKIQNNNYI
jgi:serine O-acetyltransferase